MGKTRALAAALVLAGGAIFGTAASAQYNWDPTPECYNGVIAQCATQYQTWGYATYEDCVRVEPCYYCLSGYMCGFDPRDWGAVKPDTGKPW